MPPKKNVQAIRLGEDLRRAISTFVRSVRHGADTPRSAQSETLDLLERKGSMNVAHLAKQRGVTHQTMRLIVAQLEMDGFVLRAADPGDRRSQLVSLSAEGLVALTHDRTDRAALIQELIEMRLLSEEQTILRDAIALLDRLSDGPAN